jgi:hypothetical protein
MSNHGRGECACCERKYAALRIAGTIDGVHMRQRDAYRDILLDLIEELNVAWDTDPMAIREAIDRAEARLWPVGHLHESEPPPERAILLDLIAELREPVRERAIRYDEELAALADRAEERLREVSDE